MHFIGFSGYAECSSWSLKPKGGNHEVHEVLEDLLNNQLVWVYRFYRFVKERWLVLIFHGLTSWYKYKLLAGKW